MVLQNVSMFTSLFDYIHLHCYENTISNDRELEYSRNLKII